MESESQIQSEQASGITYEHNVKESWKSKIVKFVLRVRGYWFMARILQKLEGKPNPEEVPEPPKNLMKKFDVTSWQVEGRNVFKLSPKNNKTKKHIIYLHGGGYVINSVIQHWHFIEMLINEMNCTVIVPDYPLAPTHTYIDSFKFMETLYKSTISEVDPSDLTIMGDSAGGGFCLGLALKLKKDNLPQPSNIVLLCPWLDIISTNPEMAEIAQHDVLLTTEPLKKVAEAYTRGGDVNSELVRPINGSLEGLGKISLFIGTHDILYADCKKFKSICDQKKIPINYYVYPQMMHDWVLFGFSESDHVVQEIKKLL